MIEWFALETNRDHFVVFEIASKYYISDSFVDHDGYSTSSKGFLPTVVDIRSSELNSPIPVRFSSLIPKMLMFTFVISCGISGGSMVGLMVTSSKRAYAISRSTYPEPRPPRQSTADLYLLRRHPNTVLSQCLWGLWVLVHTRYV